MPARMTATAYFQGLRNALICGILFLTFWFLLAKAIEYAAHLSFPMSAGRAFAFLWLAIFLMFVRSWLRGRASGGSVLLDCGPHPTRWLFLLNAAVFLGVGIAGGFAQFPGVPRFFGPAFGVLCGAYWAILATGRLQIREEGLWEYWGLLPWHEIENYAWSDDSTLLLEPKYAPMRFRGALPVPPEDRELITALIKKHVSVPDLA